MWGLQPRTVLGHIVQESSPCNNYPQLEQGSHLKFQVGEHRRHKLRTGRQRFYLLLPLVEEVEQTM